MITPEGFTRKTYQEILDGKIEKAKELFGEDIDTSDLTPLGKYIRINAYDQAEAEEQAEMIYYSIFPNTAIGTSLDRLCAFVGITRNPATASRYKVKVTGTSGETVAFGFLVSTEAEVEFYNTADTVIGEDGTCEIIVDCTESGTTGNVNPADICVVVNPDASVSAVNGLECVLVATDIESDTSLRKRFAEAREGLGSCNESSIASALIRVETVTSASVVANETSETDADGRPPHSFECYVSGGELHHEEIARTIFDKKPLGIKTHGQVTETVIDSNGKPHEIKFSHTANIDIEVSVEIKTNALYEGDTGKQQIVSNIKDYINNLGVGKSVILSALYGCIYSVAGVVEVTGLLMAPNLEVFSNSNIDIDSYEVAKCTSVSVQVVA